MFKPDIKSIDTTRELAPQEKDLFTVLWDMLDHDYTLRQMEEDDLLDIDLVNEYGSMITKIASKHKLTPPQMMANLKCGIVSAVSQHLVLNTEIQRQRFQYENK